MFHLAGRLFTPDVPEAEFGRVHVEGTRLLLDACADAAGVRTIVHCSTTGVVGATGPTPLDEDAPPRPGNAYERSKAEGERVARALADRHRLALATVSGDTDLGTDSGRLFARVKGAVARSEGERKSARQKRQALQAAQMGKPHRGRRAFGYEPDGLTVRPNEAKALRAAYDSVLAGSTLTSLCRQW